MLDPTNAAILAQALELIVSVVQQPWFFPSLAMLGVVCAVTYGVYVVVTARPKAQNEVADLMAKLDSAHAKLIFAEEVGKIGSFTWDFIDPTQSYWSQEMYVLFGMQPRRGAPTPEQMSEHIHPDDRQTGMEEWRKAFKSAGDFSMKFRTVADTGQVRYLAIQGKSVWTGDGRTSQVTGVAHDVTKEMEIDRAKTEFVSLASHQLKTPLTSINWLSEALLSENMGTLTETQKKYVASIHAASEHMVDMVNDLLNVSRIELGTLALRIEMVDVIQLLNDVVGEQRPTADKKGIAINLSIDQTLQPVKADKNLLRMILQNLVSNAIKYTPEKGLVECELAQGSIEAGSIFMRVKDTGMGIPEAVQHKIFERLYRAPNATASVPDGTGLGLYLVKMIIERVGGGISFESKEGQGTTFYVTLPPDWSTGFGGKQLVKAPLDPKSYGDKARATGVQRGILGRIWTTLSGRS